MMGHKLTYSKPGLGQLICPYSLLMHKCIILKDILSLTILLQVLRVVSTYNIEIYFKIIRLS